MPRSGRRILPFIRDLNPQLDDLPALLTLINNHAGDRPTLVESVFEKWTADGTRTGFSRHSIDANTLTSLSLDNLGVMSDDARLTVFGEELRAANGDLDRFKELLAKHLLQYKAGWQFARALQVMRRRGHRPRREDIADYLGEKYGIAEWRDLNNISSLHSFLEWCGVVDNYELNEGELTRLLGGSVNDVAFLEGQTLETRAYLEALVRLGGSATAGAMREGAESHLHRPLDPHKLPGRMEPLIAAGLVSYEGRRGDRTGTYSVTSADTGRLLAEVAADLAIVGAVPDEVFEHDFRWVVDRLKEDDLSSDEKGHALEVLAGMICWKLGLRHVLLREKTQYEVDAVAEYVGTTYQQWSAQCKAYGRSQVRAEHILREFGIAVLDHYDVLLFVTTSRFTRDAVFTAERIMRQSSVQLVMISGEDLERIAVDESVLFDLLSTKAGEVRELRRGDDPEMIFAELDAARGWLLADQPTGEDVWLYLQRRDFHISRSFTAALLYAWLESQSDAEGFDQAYLVRVKEER